MFQNRGIIIHPEEYNENWLNELKEAELNVLGLHPVGGVKANETLESAIRLHGLKEMQNQIKKANEMGIRVEYEAHVLGWLLPRDILLTIRTGFVWMKKGSAWRILICALPTRMP